MPNVMRPRTSTPPAYYSRHHLEVGIVNSLELRADRVLEHDGLVSPAVDLEREAAFCFTTPVGERALGTCIGTHTASDGSIAHLAHGRYSNPERI